jgi:hypothetical protein
VGTKAWVHAYGPDDIAVAPLELERGRFNYTGLLWSEYALSEPEMKELRAGPGDEVAMVGRLINFAGKQRNQPTARFGNIAMNPGELVRDGRGQRVEAFLVEMRSQAGFRALQT